MEEKVQIQLNQFYYMKVYFSHSILALQILIQIIIYSFCKITEVQYFNFIEDMLNENEKMVEGHVLSHK